MEIRIIMDDKIAHFEVDDSIIEVHIQREGRDSLPRFLADECEPYFEAMLRLDDEDKL